MMRLKIFYFLLCIFLWPVCSTAQGIWTWVKGDSTAHTILPYGGNYGVMGIPSPNNEPPGRYACSHWTDTSGRFWIFGGGFADLWMFDPSTTNWTFMLGDTGNAGVNITGAKGVYNNTNNPGSTYQGKATWVTPDNHLWLSDDYNNLWQYDPGQNEWAWMGAMGPTNYGSKGIGTTTTLPGSRVETSAAWVDSSGNLWIFGGDDNGSLNDMWEYYVTTGIWTWMSGTNNANDAGTYGQLGVGSVNNIPPGRSSNMVWKDDAGNFWLIGGEDINVNKRFQDIWMFNPNNLEWTWVGGPQGSDTTKSVGTQCDTTGGNLEGPRWENRAVWKICDNLILNHSGEYGLGVTTCVNDLWAFLPSYQAWMLLGSGPLVGRYGTKGVGNAANFPCARVGGVGFVDKNKHLWLFGGDAYNGPFVNDMWEYVPDSTCIAVANCVNTIPTGLQASASSQNITCGGSCNGNATVTASSGTPPYHYLWQPGNDTTATINSLCAGTYDVTVTDANSNSVVQSVTVTAPNPPQVTIAADTNVICPGDSASICATPGFASYAWSNGSTTACISTPDAGNYYVTVTDNNQCTAVSNQINISLFQPTPVTISVNGDTLSSYTAVSYQWYVNGHAITGDTTNTIIAPQGGTYTVTVKDQHGCYYTSSPVLVTGIDNLVLSNEVLVYPNPLQSGNWNLVVSDRLIGSLIEMYNSAGQIVYHGQVISSVTKIAPEIAGGVYFLKINSGDESIELKLVKL